jgi:dolichyl-phosphate-mannose--protein O-mannosyl transferase
MTNPLLLNKVSLHTKLLIFITIIAAILRVWGTFDYQGYFGDEAIDIPAAKDYMATGHGNWRYPYLKSIIIGFDIKIFGDNAVGWRIDNVLFAVLTIVFVYLIAQRLYRNNNIALMTAAILAFDPFTIHFSRQSVMEIPVLFFFLVYVYLLLEYCENSCNTLTWAGIAVGLTIATKAYFIFAIPLIGLYAFFRVLRSRNAMVIPLCFEFIIKLVLLPVSIYLLTCILWFGRGYTLEELLLLKFDSAWLLNKWTFVNAEILNQGGKPWEWFVKAFSFGHHLSQDGQFGRFSLQINNPLIRLLVLPSAVLVCWQAVSSRTIRHIIAPALFFSCYVLFFMVKRDVNSYSCLVLLPFAYMLVGQAVSIISSRFRREQEITMGFIFIVFVMGVYLFPVTAGFQVPVKLYGQLLEFSSLTRVF